MRKPKSRRGSSHELQKAAKAANRLSDQKGIVGEDGVPWPFDLFEMDMALQCRVKSLRHRDKDLQHDSQYNIVGKM
jgi:hypothetical protein